MTNTRPLPECPRRPVVDVRPADVAASHTTAHLRDAARLLHSAHPALALYYDGEYDRTYLLEDGEAYQAELHFARDEDAGYAALVFTWTSRDEAALRGAREMKGATCRSEAELVVAQWPEDGVPAVVSRTPLDDEAIAVDVRTLTVRDDLEGAIVELLYFAYYAAPGWFGHVGFRSHIAIGGDGLIASRLPASYVKRSLPGPLRQEGALGPAGARPGAMRLLVAMLDTGDEAYREIEVPLVGETWMSGAEILRRIPDASGRISDGAGESRDAGRQSLLGCWRKERAQGADDSLQMEFDFISETEVDYGVEIGGQWTVFRMAHWMDGNTLVLKPTPATPEDRWRLRFESADVMVLENDDTRVWLGAPRASTR